MQHMIRTAAPVPAGFVAALKDLLGAGGWV
jgi:hypothetical protein